jgi:hypothetical protein
LQQQPKKAYEPNLAVAGAQRDAHQEALVLDFAHALHGHVVGRRHVVVAHFLAFGGGFAHHAAARELQVGPAVVGFPGHEEELLLEPDVGLHRAHGVAEVLAQPHALHK